MKDRREIQNFVVKTLYEVIKLLLPARIVSTFMIAHHLPSWCVPASQWFGCQLLSDFENLTSWVGCIRILRFHALCPSLQLHVNPVPPALGFLLLVYRLGFLVPPKLPVGFTGVVSPFPVG